MSWTEQQCCSTENLKTVEHFVEDLWKSLHAACSPAFMSLFCECLLFSVSVHPKPLSQNYSCEQQNSMPWLSLSSHLTLPTTTPFSFWLLIYLLGTFIYLSPKSPHQCSRSPGTVPSLLPVGEAGLGIHRAEPTERGWAGGQAAALHKLGVCWEKDAQCCCINLSLNQVKNLYRYNLLVVSIRMIWFHFMFLNV